MRLLRLDADQPGFRSLAFRPRGLSLIVGDGHYEREHEGSANGVGKTLALRLVHLCLGGRPSNVLRERLATWRFGLEFEIGARRHRVERQGDGSGIALDGKPLKDKAFRQWLNETGTFPGETASDASPSFRELYGRFARLEPEDCRDPLRLGREQPEQSLAANLFLLGLDTTLARRKADLKARADRLAELEKAFRQEDPALGRLLRTGRDISARLRTLEVDISEAETRLSRMEIAEDYEERRRKADELTAELRSLEQRRAVIAFQLDAIAKSLTEQPDVSGEELLGFYRGLEEVFRSEALKTFAEVEAFHRRLAEVRRERLAGDRARLESEQAEIEVRLHEVGRDRDAILRFLSGRHALDDVMAVLNSLAAMREEKETLSRYLAAKQAWEEDRIAIRRQMAEDDERAQEYCAAEPLASLDERFRALSRLVYPGHDAGITLGNNTGNNKVRFDLRVTLAGQDSDGINAARILLFDWIVFRYAARHAVRHLWHDNRLFADLDPGVRAKWFTHVIQELRDANAQYIATINAENLEAMRPHLLAPVWDELGASVIIRLSGERPETKLLGVQLEA